MRIARLIVVTGLPAAGKSTLAAQLAARYRIALIGKDRIKESLFEVLGAQDAAESRRLSDASFEVMFTLAAQLLATGLDAVIEGNFRPGEHEPRLRSYSARIAQILCATDEPTRLTRLLARAQDPSRHRGHRDSQLAARGPQPCSAYLDLPGEKWRHDSADASQPLFERVDLWWCDNTADA